MSTKLKKHPIYSTNSSEEEKSLQLSLIGLITFFSMYLHSFKTLVDNDCHLS